MHSIRRSGPALVARPAVVATRGEEVELLRRVPADVGHDRPCFRTQREAEGVAEALRVHLRAHACAVVRLAGGRWAEGMTREPLPGAVDVQDLAGVTALVEGPERVGVDLLEARRVTRSDPERAVG